MQRNKAIAATKFWNQVHPELISANVSAVDPDQDLLDKLDRKYGPSILVIIGLIIGTALAAGAVAYFTLLSQSASDEVATDSAVLVTIAAGAFLLMAYRKMR